MFLRTLDQPADIGPNLKHATHYEPTPLGEAKNLIGLVPSPIGETTFIDIGAGMGRVVMLAARRAFKTVIGVEFSPSLYEVARENLKRFDDEERRCNDIRLVRRDAASYKFPSGRLAVYMYNPFRAPIMRKVLENLLVHPREILLLYHTPVERDVIKASGEFELVENLRYAAIFRRRRQRSVR